MGKTMYENIISIERDLLQKDGQIINKETLEKVIGAHGIFDKRSVATRINAMELRGSLTKTEKNVWMISGPDAVHKVSSPKLAVLKCPNSIERPDRPASCGCSASEVVWQKWGWRCDSCGDVMDVSNMELMFELAGASERFSAAREVRRDIANAVVRAKPPEVKQEAAAKIKEIEGKQ